MTAEFTFLSDPVLPAPAPEGSGRPRPPAPRWPAYLPSSVRRAIAGANAASFNLSEVKHVVLLMQENRSFDHYFGTLSGVRGFGDPTRHAAGVGALGLRPAGPGQSRRVSRCRTTSTR